MRIQYFQLIFISLLFSFDVDDWNYIKKVGNIYSIVQDEDLVHFITNNGIYTYDDIEDVYYYNFNLSSEIDFNNKIYYFYVDPNTNMYWLVDDFSIKMKHSFHDFWSEISFSRLDIMSVNQIIDIGSSSNYIWIKLFDRLIPLNQISGNVISEEIDTFEINDIDWTFGEDYGNNFNVDLSDYVIFDDWRITRSQIINTNGRILNPTVIMEDENSNVWVGTKEGSILKGSTYSHRLEVIDIGLKFNIVTTLDVSDNTKWWFADSQFLRTGFKKQRGISGNDDYFLSYWNKYTDVWEHINTNQSLLIQNTDINDLLYIDGILYIAAMDGLLIFDSDGDDWTKIDRDLVDKAIWDIEFYDNSIYIATSNGFYEISSLSNTIVNNDNNSLSIFLKDSEIYDILIDGNILYIASEKGLFEKYLDANNYKLLSSRRFKNIDKYRDNLFGNDRDMWQLDLNTLKINKVASNVTNFSLLKNLLWVNNTFDCELFNLNNSRSWDFNNHRGIEGSIIYNIKSNEDNVLFMTNQGLAIYDWDIRDYE